MKILSGLTRDIRLVLSRPPRQQYAALCYRLGEKGPEVLLLTSRDTGRWVIPKGWPMKRKPAHAVAEQEAYEEAGVRGQAETEPFGSYGYLKTLRNGVQVRCLVQVHLLQVSTLCESFPEKESRRLDWVSPAQASQRVKEGELQRLFGAFAQHMAHMRQSSGQPAETL